jgi:hypothetical protein
MLDARVNVHVQLLGDAEAVAGLRDVRGAEADVGAEGERAARGIDDLNEGLQGVGESARSTAGLAGDLTERLVDLAKGMLAVGAARQAWEWMVEGGELADLDATVQRLGVDLDALSKAAGGTFSDAALGRAALVADKLGKSLGLTGAQTRALTEDAVRLADAFGGDLEDATRRLFTAVSGETGSLKEAFGLFVDGGKAVEDYADKLGVAVDQLTEAQKRTATLEAIQGQLNKALESAPVQTYADRLDAISAAADNAAAALKRAAAETFLLPILEASTGQYVSTNVPSGSPEADRLAQARNRAQELRRQLAESDFETSGFFDVSLVDDRLAAEKALRETEAAIVKLEAARVAADRARAEARREAEIQAAGDAENARVLAEIAAGRGRDAGRGGADRRPSWDPRAFAGMVDASMGGAPGAALGAIADGLKRGAEFEAMFATNARELGVAILDSDDALQRFIDTEYDAKRVTDILAESVLDAEYAYESFKESFKESLSGMVDSALDSGALLTQALGGITQSFGMMVTNLIVSGDAGTQGVKKWAGNMAAGLASQAFSMAFFLEGMALVLALAGTSMPWLEWSAGSVATAGAIAGGIGLALAGTARALGADTLGGAGAPKGAGGGGGGGGARASAGFGPFGGPERQAAPTVIVYIGGEQVTRGVRTETRKAELRGGIIPAGAPA